MKLLVESAMVFFGTLMVAALVALGRPAGLQVVMASDSSPAAPVPAQVLASTGSGGQGAALPPAGR
jgi:hypothetical protein